MLGDCLERMKEIPDGSVDLILTDPPYGTTACKWDSVIPFEPMWGQLNRIIKPNGAIVTYKNQPAIDKTKGKIPLAGNSHVYRVKKDCGMIA